MNLKVAPLHNEPLSKAVPAAACEAESLFVQIMVSSLSFK